ncbi:unnamed protein product [Rhizoctonia solani]|uniref:RING-type domain-containing protein n=1 Tax=Rhizoctonia solani TaxID=456999 RepID=A0A8H3H3V1_9AGAM|nr:unnamed protein product [Rhizoctonia solani]
MTCLRPWGCGHEFCWTCLADYSTILRDGNHRHNPDCTYYTGSRSSFSDQTSLSESYNAPEPHWTNSWVGLDNLPGRADAQTYRPPTPILARDIEVWSESIEGSSDSSTHASFESPPVPMPLRLRESWEDMTTLESNRPSDSDSWRGSTSSSSDGTDRWEEPPEDWSRRMSGVQATYAQARRPSYTETWWPPTPPRPSQAEDWDRDRRYGRVW